MWVLENGWWYGPGEVFPAIGGGQEFDPGLIGAEEAFPGSSFSTFTGLSPDVGFPTFSPPNIDLSGILNTAGMNFQDPANFPGLFQMPPNQTIAGTPTTGPTFMNWQGTGSSPGTQFQLPQAGTSPGGLMAWLQSLTAPQATGLGIAAVGGTLGLMGIFQKLTQGAPVTHQEVTRAVQQSSPQEQQLFAQAVQTLQQVQQMSFNQDLQATISALARGELPINQSTVQQVTQTFGKAAGDIAEAAIEQARQRGFAGGAELLGSAAGPLASRGLANLSSDVANAILNLSLGLPQMASGLQGQQISQALAPLSQIGQLLGIGQQERFNAAPQFLTQTGPQSTLLDTLGPFGQLAGGIGGTLGALGSFGQPSMASVLQEAIKSGTMSGSNALGMAGLFR